MSTSNTPTIHLVIGGRKICRSVTGGGVSPNMLNDVNCVDCIASDVYSSLRKGHAVIVKTDKLRGEEISSSAPALESVPGQVVPYQQQASLLLPSEHITAI